MAVCTSLPVTVGRERSAMLSMAALQTIPAHTELSAGGWVLLALSNVCSPSLGSVARAMAYRDLQAFAAAAISAGC